MRAPGKAHEHLSALSAEGCAPKKPRVKALPLETLQALVNPPKAKKFKVSVLSVHAAHLIRQLVIYQIGLMSAVEKDDTGLIKTWAQAIARTANSLSNCTETYS